jgi:ribosomal protein L11 methyltransferase
MKMTSVWQVSLLTSREAEEAALELMAAVFSQPASSYEDLDSGICRISVYLTRRPVNWAVLRGEIIAGSNRLRACGLDPAPGKISLQELGRKNWAESWKRHFKSMSFGKALLVRPTWSRARPAHGQAEVVLDPGLSFGTGQHPTTGFCLAQIVAARKLPGRRFLDVGTGSGILAICAAKLGFSPVVAFDNDPESIRVAAQNARRNHVRDHIQIDRGDVAKLSLKPRARYDLVCANLIANLLFEHRDRLIASVRSGGTLVLAGILAQEFDLVQAAFEKRGTELISSRVEKEWKSGAFQVR